ncbi:MAG: polyprenyl synthetase family protein [Candidatus Omnitrophota bacterium]
MLMTYEQYFKRHLGLIEKSLKGLLLAHEARPVSIHKAMQYAIFTGGKRFRPVLTLSACEACGGKPQDAIPAALAIEAIHTYSLIHDDLPALDNDDMRRGKPTCHKKFGEANAILAGDALLTLAFEWISEISPAQRAIHVLREISRAAGTRGMIGGQVADLEAPARKKTLAEHDFISRLKTGALIRVSAVAGAIAAGAGTRKLEAVTRYGECLGLAFQVVDDILDGDGYCKVMSVKTATAKAVSLIAQAKREAAKLGRKAAPLVFLADFLGSRIPHQS